MTPYDAVNVVLTHLSVSLIGSLGEQLVGLYLTGSLTYGDFDPGSSDIDFLVVLSKELSGEQFAAIAETHTRIGAATPRWEKRLEGSYISQDMIATKNRPERVRPYLNAGELQRYHYGNAWIINLQATQAL
jgi:predicted nucleotidyltransferase